MPESMDGRLKVVGAFMTIVSIIMIAQLISFQFQLDPEVEEILLSRAAAYEGRETVILPNRGNIYDRQGRVLAVNRLEYQVGISPSAVGTREDREQAAKDIARLLDMNEIEVFRLLQPNEDGYYEPYVPLKNFVPLEIGEELQKLDIPGLVMDDIYLREYPQGALTAQILGFVNFDQDTGDARTRGIWGVESFYQAELAGQSQIGVESDIPLDVSAEEINIRNGQDLVLTIDRDIQWAAQDELENYILTEREELGAASTIQGGTIIVMNPRTGEILAMATYPYLDLEEYLDMPEDERPTFNPAISEIFEPGSIFKIISAAVALDIPDDQLSQPIDLNSSFPNYGCERMAGVEICDSDRRNKGSVTFTQCIVQSLNTCTARWNQLIGATLWYDYLEQFGFGRPTNVDLAAEEDGLVNWYYSPYWSEANFLQTSFGQGISVTAIQMLTAANTIANDGIMMQPHIVKERRDGEQIFVAEPTPIGRPITPASAQQVLSLMTQAVNNEGAYGEKAKVPGYLVAGKTGTAQQPDGFGGYSDEVSWASFIGFLPADDPQLSILIVLDNPEGYWGSQTATPLFGSLASRLVTLMEMPPDELRYEIIESGGHPFDRDY
jgi:cell division protein FtsI/penicillin-binding protein 2